MRRNCPECGGDISTEKPWGECPGCQKLIHVKKKKNGKVTKITCHDRSRPPNEKAKSVKPVRPVFILNVI